MNDLTSQHADLLTVPRPKPHYLLNQGDHFVGLSYWPHDYRRAMTAVIHWKLQGIIDDDEQQFLGELILKNAYQDGVLPGGANDFDAELHERDFAERCEREGDSGGHRGWWAWCKELLWGASE